MWGKTILKPVLAVVLAALLFACQSAPAGDDQFAKDPESLAAFNIVTTELRTTGKVSPDNFEKLKALREKFPASKNINQTYKNALILRKDVGSLEEFLASQDEASLTPEDKKGLASLYTKNGKYQQAVDLLLPLSKTSPKDADLYESLGVSYYNLGKLDEAGKAFDDVWDLLLASKKAEAIATRGIIFYKKDNPGKAIETLKKALQIDPDHISSNYTLSRIYNEQGDTEQAESYRKRTDELQNRLKAETFAKSKNVKLTYDLQDAWKEKRYKDVISYAKQMVASTTDPKQKIVLYQYLYESYKVLGMKSEAASALAEVQKLQG